MKLTFHIHLCALEFGHEFSKEEMFLYMFNKERSFPPTFFNLAYPWAEEVLRNLITPGE